MKNQFSSCIRLVWKSIKMSCEYQNGRGEKYQYIIALTRVKRVFYQNNNIILQQPLFIFNDYFDLAVFARVPTRNHNLTETGIITWLVHYAVYAH